MKCLILTIPLFATLALAAPDEGKRLALVIGNDAYQTIKPLKNAINDARAMDKALTSVGFKVIKVENGTKGMLEQAAADFFNAIGNGDTVLFYYAGHAVQVQGENVLIPVDLENARNLIEVKIKSFSVASVFEYLKQSKAKNRIVILDSCRSNPFGEGSALQAGLAIPTNAGPSTYMAFSTSPNAVAGDNPDGKNSWFTEALANLIPTPDITIDDLFNRVRERVEKATLNRQTPWSQSGLKTFYFNATSKLAALEEPTRAESFFYSAKDKLAEGNWREALALCERSSQSSPAAELLPRITELRAFLTAYRDGHELFNKGNYAEAGLAYKKAFNAYPLYSEAAYLSAGSYVMADKFPEAVEMFRTVRQFGQPQTVKKAETILKEIARISPEATAEMQRPALPLPAPNLPPFQYYAQLTRKNYDALPPKALDFAVLEEELARLEQLAAEARAALERAAQQAQAAAATNVETAAANSPDEALGGAYVEIHQLSGSRDLDLVESAPEPPLSSSGVTVPGGFPLTISTKPAGAIISIEGDSQRCKSPCVFSVRPGRIVINGSREGYRTVSRIYNFDRKNSIVEFQMDRKAGSVRIEHAQAGARIKLNGKVLPQITPATVSLPEGKYEMKSFESGVASGANVVEVEDSSISNVKLK
jgi:tetratricopeptide (TPR) repeat protein